MLRFFMGIVGAVFATVLLISFFSNVSTALSSPAPATAEEEFHLHPEHQSGDRRACDPQGASGRPLPEPLRERNRGARCQQ